MPADLVEAGAGGGTVLEAHGFQDGVFAVFFADGEQRLLHAALAGGLLRRLRGLRFRSIGKEAQLAEFFRRLRVLLRQDVLRDEIHPAHEQPPVHDAVKQLARRAQQLPGRGGVRAQPQRAVRGLRDRPPVRVGRDRAVIGPAQLRPGQALAVVADAQHELVGHKAPAASAAGGRLSADSQQSICF